MNVVQTVSSLLILNCLNSLYFVRSIDPLIYIETDSLLSLTRYTHRTPPS